MSWDNKKDDWQLSVRTGPTIGKASENRMLDAMGGANTVKKRIQNNLDGSITMAHTRGPGNQPEFITTTTETTNCKIGMDSGVVNLIDASFIAGQHANDAGSLLRTAYVQEHSLLAPTDDTPVVDVIYPPATKGVAPAIGAVSKSFPLGSYGKKRVAALCPPSIFTGKTRLYVQSMYGRHESATTITVGPGFGVSTPSIVLSNGVEVTTSCGVYLEPETAKHFLISVSQTTALVYPLVSTTCGEKLRTKLLDPAISAENKERIEAYILSQALPKISDVVALPIGGFDSVQMGYGWHFNWAGTCCDIVVTNTVSRSGGGLENESTHYRITFTLNGETWSQSPSTVEGPVRWMNQKYTQVITSPSWDFTGLKRTGHRLGTPYGDAPYYAFYIRDELNVCRFTATEGVITERGERSPSYLNVAEGSWPHTLGTDAMSVKTWGSWTGTTITLSCGGVSVGCLAGVVHGAMNSASDKVRTSGKDTSSGWYNSSFWVPVNSVQSGRPAINWRTTPLYQPPFGSIMVEDGIDPATYTVAERNMGDYEYLWWTYTLNATFSRESSSFIQSTNASFIAVIPFNDAEAAYVLSTQTDYETHTDVSVWNVRSGAFFAAQAIGASDQSGGVTPYGDIVGISEMMGDNASGEILSSSYGGTRVIDPVTTTVTKLVCNAGVFGDVVIPTPSAFFSPNSDTVPVIILNYTSATGSATWSADTGLNHGNLPASLAGIPFTYVGWA